MKILIEEKRVFYEYKDVFGEKNFEFYKAYFDHDTADEDERRLVISGRYPNKSLYVRIVVDEAIYSEEVPAESLPFGFRGIPALKTCDTLTDGATALNDVNGIAIGGTKPQRLGAAFLTGSHADLVHGILPPLPYRFKVTRGSVSTSGLVGAPGTNERVDGRFYWGVKNTLVPAASVKTDGVLDTNIGNVINPTIRNYTKFHGIAGIGSLLTGSAADEQNNNKFTSSKCFSLYTSFFLPEWTKSW